MTLIAKMDTKRMQLTYVSSQQEKLQACTTAVITKACTTATITVLIRKELLMGQDSETMRESSQNSHKHEVILLQQIQQESDVS